MIITKRKYPNTWLAKLIPVFSFFFLSACSSSNEDALALTDQYFESGQEEEIFLEILNLAEYGDLIAIDFVAQRYAIDETLAPALQAQIVDIIGKNNGPITDFSLALAALDRLPDADDFSQIFDWLVSGVGECRLAAPMFEPSIDWAKFILLGSNGQEQINRLLANIERCANHYWEFQWLLGDLDWEINKNPAGRLAQIELLKDRWKFINRNGWGNEWVPNTLRKVTSEDLVSALMPTNPATDIYIKSLFHFPNVDSLNNVLARLEEDALAGDTKAARSLGIYYSGQLMRIMPDFSINSSKADEARNWFSIAADSDPVAKFYLWAMDSGERTQESGPEESQLLVDSLKGGFHYPACMAFRNHPQIMDEIQIAFPAYSEAEISNALLLVCEEGHLNQFELIQNEFGRIASSSQSYYAYTGNFNNFIAYPGAPSFPMGVDANEFQLTKGLAAVIVGLLFLYLSFLTFDANPSNTKNKAIALILALEGYILLSLFGLSLLPVTLESLSVGRFILTLLPIAAFILPLGYVLFLSTSDTHLGRLCRTPLVRVGIPGLICVWVLYMQWKWDILVYPIFAPDFITFNVQPSFIGAFALILLVFHLIILGNLAYQYFFEKRNNKDSAETQFYLAAYLSRFTFIAFTFVSVANAMFLGSGMNISQQNLVSITFIIGEMIYGILFSYGILRAELFGVKRLIKRGLVKLSLACLLFGAYYLTESFVSENFSDLLGNMAGLISAATVFAFERPISRRAYHFIDLLIPDDQAMSNSEKTYAYLYELAIEDGIISSNEKRMLEFTAENLSLSENQVEVIENNVRKSS